MHIHRSLLAVGAVTGGALLSGATLASATTEAPQETSCDQVGGILDIDWATVTPTDPGTGDPGTRDADDGGPEEIDWG